MNDVVENRNNTILKNASILCFCLLFFACERKNGESLSFELQSIDCNYFENDSLQQIAGYYPFRIYYNFSVRNTTSNDIQMPFGRITVDSGYISNPLEAEFRGAIFDSYHMPRGESITIRSNSETTLKLIVSVPAPYLMENNIKPFDNFIRKIKLKYHANEKRRYQ